MLQKLLFFVLLICTALVHCTQQNAPEKDWWQTAQFYQIYPRSFKDSDGDGIGDLKGITSKLEYLKELGITAAWLSPIFKSPMVDFGYDISDFYDIQPEYGTLDDFRELIARAKALGIKIILDFVPNHSSDESEWFKKSVAREKGYEDFYVWHDGKIDASGKRIPPSNWLQYFRGSAWQWNAQRQQFYLHQFAVQQPDLNYRNPAVVEQMKRVLRYWLREGVAGFRCDAVPTLFEVAADAHGQFPDEAASGVTDDADDRNSLRVDYVENQPETIDMTMQWRQVMDEHQRIYGGETRVLLIETSSPAWFTMQFYGNKTVNGAHLPFNFNLINVLKESVSATYVQRAIDMWLQNMPAGRTANWVIGNHDQRRAASRYGIHRMDAMNMLIMILPGASVTYQGEELGMIDGEISWEDTVDPWGCRSNPEIFEQFTRDPARTPFQWTAGTNAGFSSATKTWLPLAGDYLTANVASESSAIHSHLKIYKSLIELRKSSKILLDGNLKYAALNDGIFVVKRALAANNATILYVANFGDGSYAVNLKQFDTHLPIFMKLKIRSVDSTKSDGTLYDIEKLSMAVGEALVLSTE